MSFVLLIAMQVNNMIRFIKLILIQIGLIKIKEVFFSEITLKQAQIRLIELGAMPD